METSDGAGLGVSRAGSIPELGLEPGLQAKVLNGVATLTLPISPHHLVCPDPDCKHDFFEELFKDVRHAAVYVLDIIELESSFDCTDPSVKTAFVVTQCPRCGKAYRSFVNHDGQVAFARLMKSIA